MNSTRNSYSSLLTNERGLGFPFVFALSILFITVTLLTIEQYRNEMIYTEVYQKTLLKQNLMEMAEMEMLDGWAEVDSLWSDEFYYSSELGQAYATCQQSNETHISCHWEVIAIDATKSSLVNHYPTTAQ